VVAQQIEGDPPQPWPERQRRIELRELRVGDQENVLGDVLRLMRHVHPQYEKAPDLALVTGHEFSERREATRPRRFDEGQVIPAGSNRFHCNRLFPCQRTDTKIPPPWQLDFFTSFFS